MGAGEKEAQDGIGGGQPGRKGQPVPGLFYLGKGHFQGGAGWIVGTAVLVAFMFAGGFLGVGRGKVHRRHDGACIRVGLGACMYSQRMPLHGAKVQEKERFNTKQGLSFKRRKEGFCS